MEGLSQIARFAQDTGVIVTLLVTLVTVPSGLIYWLQRRIRAATDVAMERSAGAHATLGRRMGEMEKDIIKVRQEVQEMGTRVGNVERTMETVARKDDLALVSQSMSEFRGSVTAQLTMVLGQVDTLYKAALRASNKDTGT